MSSRPLPLREICLILLLCTVLSACTRSGPITITDHLQSLESDIKALFQSKEIDKPITLHDAMARALKHNMDHKLAAIEQEVANGNVTLARMDMLPALDLKGQYIGRNKESASSSRSITTGTQSLEPSISTDKDRQTRTLEASWDILDTGLSFVQAKQQSNRARITTERKRKVAHNIIQDVRYAYWRAAGAQEILSDIDSLIKKGNSTIHKIRKAEQAGVRPKTESLRSQARLLNSIDELMTMKAQLSFAHTELSSLMNLPPSTKFKLSKTEKDNALKAPLPNLDIQNISMEKIALLMRPETREEYLKKRIADSNVKLAIFETFPGAKLILSNNYDSNQFLKENQWLSFSAGLTQSLIKLFTLPARLNQAKTEKKLTTFRRYALTLAVIAQVHISKTRLDLAKDRYNLLKQINDINSQILKIAFSKKKANALREEELLEAKIGMLLSRIRTYIAFADMQNAYGQMLNSLGLDIVPQNALDKTTEELAALLDESLSTLNTKSLEDALHYIKAHESVPNNKSKNDDTTNSLKSVSTTKQQRPNITFMSFKGLYTEASLR